MDAIVIVRVAIWLTFILLILDTVFLTIATPRALKAVKKRLAKLEEVVFRGNKSNGHDSPS